ncbi:MAG: hypothetical protein ACI9N1_000814, partial [Flavobacteriales bacterium]
ENLEKELISAFEMQEGLIPKVQGLLKEGNVSDEEKKKTISRIKKSLDNDPGLTTEYALQLELTNVLSAIIYAENSGADTKMLEDLRTTLDGAENRIRTKRKQYNKAISDYKSGAGADNKYKKI